jgi:hypothetical protein
MKTRFLLFGFLALALISLTTFGPGTVWGQETPLAGTEEEVPPKKEMPEKVLPRVPAEAPGYFPAGLPPSPASSLEMSNITQTLGPTSGPLAPYGNPAAYDTLLRGWQAHKLGVFRVSPFLEYDGMFRTNVFSSHTDKQSDYVNVINPGLRFELPLAQRHRISLGYLGNYFIYSRLGNLSHYDQNTNADLLLNFRGGLSVRMGNAFRYATIEPSAEEPRKRPYFRDTPYLQAMYTLTDRWKMQGYYQFDLFNFSENIDKTNDYQEQAGGATLFYRFWPKTAALAQFIVTDRTYTNSPKDSNTIYSPLAGLTWEPTAKITGTAKFGYSFTSYHQSLPERNNSPGGVVMSVQTLYQYSRYTNVSLTVQRSKQDNIDFNNSPFWNTGIFVNLTHDWHFLKATTYAGVAFINNSYINPSLDVTTFKRREDNNIYLSAGISRPITRWLRLRLDYNYLNDASNFSGLGYNEHRILFGIQVAP